MATLNELTSYQGNAGLAGGTSGTPSAIGGGDFTHALDAADRLTAATMQMNRDLWTQTNVDIQQQAAEAAKSLNITYGNLIPEDQPVIDAAVKDLFDYYGSNPNAVRYIVDPVTGENNAASYREFQQKKAYLDHLIVRGNIRANQLDAIQGAISKKTDQDTIDKMNSYVDNERKKPIGENLLMPPDPAQFNWSAYLADKAPIGAQSASFIQRFPNDILDVTMNMYDPNKAALAVVNDINGDTPISGDLKKNLAQQHILVNQLMSQHMISDGNGNMVLDRQGLQNDPNAKALLDQINFYNSYIDKINGTEVVENGQRTHQKIRQFMGYNSDLPKVDITNLSDVDLARIGLAYKSQYSSATKAQVTNQGVTQRGQTLDYLAAMARIKGENERWWANFNKGDKEKMGIADESLSTYANLMNAPDNGMGKEMAATPYTYKYDDKGKLVDKTQAGPSKVAGYEVGLTPQLVTAFAIPTNKASVKEKITDGSGSFTNQSFKETTTAVSQLTPQHLYVVKDPSGDANKNYVNVRYDDGTVRSYSSNQVFTAMNKLYGNDEKIQMAVSSAKIKRLAQMGLTQPDANAILNRLGNIQQSTIQQDQQLQPGQKPRSGKLPRPY